MSGFTELYATACTRIFTEWDLSARQRDLCLLLSQLTYGAEMLTLAFTRQQDLAEALGWDAPSLSRVLRSVISLGIVKLEVCAGEKLLSLQLFADAVKTRLTTGMQAARDRLRQMQRLRDNGRCDTNGQMRMPEIIPSESESPRADALAFRAMVETDMAATKPSPSPATSNRHPSPGSTVATILRDLRTEITRLANPTAQLTQFERYRPWWRKQATLHPARLQAAIAAHRERARPADKPGGWIMTAMQRIEDPRQTLLPL